MLLQAGLSFQKLLLLTLVSGVLGLGGAALGVGLSLGPAPLTPWVFGVTAGVFLYVALVDMVRGGGWAGGCGGEGSARPASPPLGLESIGPTRKKYPKVGVTGWGRLGGIHLQSHPSGGGGGVRGQPGLHSVAGLDSEPLPQKR